MQYNKELLEKLKLQGIDLTKHKNIKIPRIKLGKIDNESIKIFLILSFMNKMSKQLNHQSYNIPYPNNFSPYSPFPYQPTQPQIVMMPSNGYYNNAGGSSFSGSADDIKEFIYNQTIDYRNAYEQNMRYISDEFEEIKKMINRK